MNRVGKSSETSRTPIVIGGPRRPLLEGLREVASRTCHVLAVSANFTVIQQAVRLLTPDCAIIDCGIGCWELESVLDRLGSIAPGLRILALLPDDRVAPVENCGWLNRELLTVVPASASEEFFHERLSQIIGGAPCTLPAVPQPPSVALRVTSQNMLTPRQHDILDLICSAESTKGIARILDISTRTVEFHKYRMMKALAVNTMAELILFGVVSGLGSGSRRYSAPRHDGANRAAMRGAMR